MEALKDALLSLNMVAWAIVLGLVVLLLKLLQKAGKGFVIIIVISVLVFVLCRFFPGVIAPMVDFVKGGWMGDSR